MKRIIMKKIIMMRNIVISILLFVLSNGFTDEICGYIYQKTNFYVVSFEIIYPYLKMLMFSIMIYCCNKYIFKMTLSDMGLSIIKPKKYWCIVAIFMPIFVSMSYLATHGNFYIESLSRDEAIYVIVYTVLQAGITTALSEEMIFRGMIFSFLRKMLADKYAIIATVILYSILYMREIECYKKEYCMKVMLFTVIFSAAMTLVTYESGSILSAVLIRVCYNILFMDSLIFHIGTEREKIAMVNYVFESKNWIFTGVSKMYPLQNSLPGMVGFLFVMILASWKIRMGKYQLKKYAVKNIK